MSPSPVHIIGAGLAGSEAAWQIAQAGVPVVLHEMRPTTSTAAQFDASPKQLCSSEPTLHKHTGINNNKNKVNKTKKQKKENKSRKVQEMQKMNKAKEERNHNLQYAGIAISLITLIILFFALSRSIIVKTKFIEFFSVLELLAVFEFINLFIHPYLAHITNDSPILMLGVLIAIGALLIPFHHKLEKWITNIMVEKNKKIRLAAAKKTIEQLEGKAE